MKSKKFLNMNIFIYFFSSIIFFIFLSPISILFKLFKKDFLNKKIKKNVKSYWEKLK